jgi:saccharopepsin
MRVSPHHYRTIMLLSAIAPLLLLPYVTASGVHRLKLKKIAPVASNPALETAYLAEKYGSTPSTQLPLMGAGGEGRRIRLARPGENAEDFYWTQDGVLAQGGHTIPLTSQPHLRCGQSKSLTVSLQIS